MLKSNYVNACFLSQSSELSHCDKRECKNITDLPFVYILQNSSSRSLKEIHYPFLCLFFPRMTEIQFWGYARIFLFKGGNRNWMEHLNSQETRLIISKVRNRIQRKQTTDPVTITPRLPVASRQPSLLAGSFFFLVIPGCLLPRPPPEAQYRKCLLFSMMHNSSSCDSSIDFIGVQPARLLCSAYCSNSMICNCNWPEQDVRINYHHWRKRHFFPWESYCHYWWHLFILTFRKHNNF